MAIAKRLAEKKARGEKALVAYITAGDPSLTRTAHYVRLLSRAGADVIELGVPHSDPIADGPTNLKAAERALRSGTSLAGILETVGSLRAAGETVPLVLFTYYNPVLKMGLARFTAEAKRQGVDGALVVDLPPEEAADYCRAMEAAGLETVFLASPTTPVDRLTLVDAASTGFVYYISRAGVTGARSDLSASLPQELEKVRARVKKPLWVGFGISTPSQASQVARLADGVVVGSLLVDCIAREPDPEVSAQLETLVRSIKAAL
jgi:tryptophan synthase alpha chain